jgi:hypothetical protein
VNLGAQHLGVRVRLELRVEHALDLPRHALGVHQILVGQRRIEVSMVR